MCEPDVPPETPGSPSEKERLQLKKLNYETELARIEVGRWRRFLRGVSLFAPGITLIAVVVTLFLGLGQLWNLQQKNEYDDLRARLNEVGSSEPSTRLSAISRLSTYKSSDSILQTMFSWLTDAPSPQEINEQIIVTIIHALSIETSSSIKEAMLDLLDSQRGAQALIPLQKLRFRLVVQLKNEHPGRSSEYWNNLRETLLYTAIAISNVTGSSPDFRCFPFKGIKFRQLVLTEGADFSGATLAYAEFWGGGLRGANFNNANLYNARLKHLDLTGASFEGAQLLGAKFGPRLHGLAPEMFAGSSWRKADWDHIPDFLEQLNDRYEANEGGEVSAADRDAHCAKLLSEEFEVP